MFSVNVGMWMLAIVVLLYVGLGGLRSVAYVDTAQCILLWSGIVTLGIISMRFAGGFDALTSKFGDIVAWINSGGTAVPAWADPEAVKVFLANKKSIFKITPDGYSHFVAVPGVLQFVAHGPNAVGGTWTGLMILSYMFALMGIHASPAFSMWAFANKNPKPFPLQQVWASTLGIGFALFIFTAMQGMGGWVLSLLPGGTGGETVLPLANLVGGKQANLVPYLIHLMKDTAPFAVGLLAICALAAMQSTGAAYMSTLLGPCHCYGRGRFGADIRHDCTGRHRDAGCLCDLLRVYDVPGPDCGLLLEIPHPSGSGHRADMRYASGAGYL
jgi:Na+/proline symporter